MNGISRRTVLRAAGVAIALPWLESLPLRAETSGGSSGFPKRFAVLFNVDSNTGRLTFVEEQGTGGFKPRHFGIDPSATYLAVGNQDSDTILVARIDAGNGRLKPSGVFAHAPSPVCMKFLPPGER